MNNAPVASHAIRLKMNMTDWALLFLLSLTWGCSFFFMEIALRELPVLSIVTARIVLGAIIINAFIFLRGRRLKFGWPVWRAFIFIALVGQVIPFCLIVWGQTHITSGMASILNATVPFFTLVMAHLMTSDERMSAKGIIGVIIGFIGVAIIIDSEALFGTGNAIWGKLAVILAAVLYGASSIYARRFREMSVPPMCVAAGQLLCSSLILIPLTLYFDRPWTIGIPSNEVIAAMIALGLFCTALAFIVYYRLVATVGANNTSLVTFLVPVMALWLGVTFLGEAFAQPQWIGMAFIALGLFVLDGRFFATIKRLIK